MKKKHYTLILGAGGNVGGKIAEELLERGAHVAVVGRSRSRLQQFEGRATLFEGDFDDDAFLKQALAYASSLFLTVPDNALLTPAATAARLKNLLAGTAVKFILNISNCITRKGGVATRLVAFEEALNASLPQHLLHLRCANFFENLNWGLHTPYHPDLKLPYISAYEIAHVAASHLQKQDTKGKQVQVLLGERDYSMAELAAAAGVRYQQLPYTPENEAFYRPFNEGNFEVETRTSHNTSAPSHEKFTLEYFLEHELSAAVV
ncbi:NmrA family NAD(P)-binding protein [Pontibacter akesuensis]|nr:NAD(P)H-binding protein [Pontibacter akesuensis]